MARGQIQEKQRERVGLELLVAVYGAGLATAVAAGQLIAWWRRRPKVEVQLSWLRLALSNEDEESVGTPCVADGGDDARREQILVNFKVLNRGGAPVQIVAILIESVSLGKTTYVQVAPSPLPSILNPGTQLNVPMQKEPLDMETDVVFFGVVDALGKRYSAGDQATHTFIKESWNLPTRVKVYQRRDDPSQRVLAFQSRHATELKRSESENRPKNVLAQRARPQGWPLLES